MALRNFFKFREQPESETSKPFLEHLEDLRWTIVKMAITLLVAMVVCFAFRTSLVQIMQRPLHDIDPQIGALRAMGVTDSLTISFRLAFYAGIVFSFPVASLFPGRIRPARPDRGGKKVCPTRDPGQFRTFSHRRAGLLLLAVAEDDPFLFSTTRHRSAGRRLGRCRNIIRS